MFRVENNVPDVYVNESRDFQLFSRLYDLVFQASRFSIDSIENVSDTMRCNDILLPLIATKVGFFTNLNLTSNADRKILSAFPYIIRYKGSLEGIQLVANLFQRIVNTSVSLYLDESDKDHITIVFENYTSDISLLNSLLEYIRPTGLLIDYAIRSNIELDLDYVTSDKVSITTLRGKGINDEEDEFNDINIVQQVRADNNKNLISNIGFTQAMQISENTTGENI